MGIKYLNKLIRNNCQNSLEKVHFSSLRHKKLAIDISIYLYKYQYENKLIENMYLMISLFRLYNITPVFIFDGKPPAEKKELLLARRQNKINSENRYLLLEERLKTCVLEDEQQLIMEEMENEKKNFVKIKQSDIENVKTLIRLYGVSYYDAPGEAEELCALLVKKNIVDGCISEDMDLFLYGCNKVYRYLSLANCSLICYNTNQILKKLGCNLAEFKLICILSGTDYYSFKLGNLNKCIQLFEKYLQVKSKYTNFYEWLKINNIVHNNEYTIIDNIINMFDFSNIEKNNLSEQNLICKNIQYNKKSLHNFMKDYGFIYLCS